MFVYLVDGKIIFTRSAQNLQVKVEDGKVYVTINKSVSADE